MTEYLYKRGFVEAEEKIVVGYGLETIAGNLFGLAITLLIGGFLGFLPTSFLLWMLVFPLRKCAGGFHAQKRMNCIGVSISILIASSYVFILKQWPVKGYIAVAGILFLIIFIMAPIDNANKRLDKQEKSIYRRKTRGILCLEGMLFAMAVLLKWQQVYSAIVAGFFIVAVALVFGKNVK